MVVFLRRSNDINIRDVFEGVIKVIRNKIFEWIGVVIGIITVAANGTLRYTDYAGPGIKLTLPEQVWGQF